MRAGRPQLFVTNHQGMPATFEARDTGWCVRVTNLKHNNTKKNKQIKKIGSEKYAAEEKSKTTSY